MSRNIQIESVYGDVETKKDQLKIIKDKVRGKKISLATTIDDGFIFNLENNKDSIGDFLDMEVDAEHKVLILHFKKI